MDSHDHLFELVKSLSKSEKGYFKKVNSFHVKGEQNNYMLLFDSIDKMETFDEQLLKKNLGTHFSAQLPFLKHYLYYQLLDSLDQYYQSSNVEINKWICKTEILYKKGLTSQAQKILEKAMHFAAKKEKFAYQLQLTRMRYEYLTEEENKDKMVLKKDVLLKDLNDLRAKIDNLYIYFQLRIELNQLRSETGHARNKEAALKYKSLLEHPALEDEHSPLSVSARYHFYTMRSIIFDYMHHYELAYTSCENALKLFEAHPALFEESISVKIQTLHRKCTIACTLGKFHEALEDITALRALKTSHEKYMAQIFQYGYHQEFQVYLWTTRSEELLKRVSFFMEEYKRHAGSISKTFELRIFCQISEACFIEGKFEEALEWINKAVNAAPSAFRDDVVSGIKIQEIFTHLELGHLRVLKSKIAATGKYLRTKNKPFKFEQYVLSFLHDFISASSEVGRSQILMKAQHSIEKIFRDRSETMPLKYFYLRAWFESKSENRPLYSVLQKQLQHYHFEERKKYKLRSAR